VYALTQGKKGSWAESVVYTFKGSTYEDGSGPDSEPMCNPNLAPAACYVTTVDGGTSNNGTFVALLPSKSGPWTESFVYSFGGTPDGATPMGNLFVDKQGNIYGTTKAGGTNGTGAVYRMQPKASSYGESILYASRAGPMAKTHTVV
jgi:uncharacterized repeat protein (TIGR03803 family)